MPTPKTQLRPVDGETITQLEPIIQDAITKTVKGGVDPDTRDELAQLLRVHLWTYSLPRFDPERGVLITTFAHDCCRRYLLSWLRSRTSRAARDPLARAVSLSGPGGSNRRGVVSSQIEDDRIEDLAGRIMHDGAGLLTKQQVKVLRAMSKKKATRKQVAKKLGYGSEDGVHAIITRIRRRLENVTV